MAIRQKNIFLGGFIMNTTTTPPSTKKETFKFLFAIRDCSSALLEKLENDGVPVHKDQNEIYACACFDNTVDYNAFKAQFA